MPIIGKASIHFNSSEAVPYAFRDYAFCETVSKLTDIEAHSLIDNPDPNLRTTENFHGGRGREFYAMSPEETCGILECIVRIFGTIHRLHKVKETEEEKKESIVAEETFQATRRLVFAFSSTNWGGVVFARDPFVVETVIDDRRTPIQAR